MGCAGRPDLLLCALALFGVCLLPEARARVYTNHWALKIAGGFAEANRIAGKYGFINLGQVSGAPSPGSRCAPAAVPPCASCSLPAKFPGSRFYFLAPIYLSSRGCQPRGPTPQDPGREVGSPGPPDPFVGRG